MISLNNWSLEESSDKPLSTYFYQNNLKVIKGFMPDGTIRCFIEVIDENGKTIECLANHHKNIEDALKHAESLLSTCNSVKEQTMNNNTDKITNHGGSSILLFNYLNSLAVLGTNQEHVEMIVKILNSIPGTMIMAAHSGEEWFITYSYFGYYSIGPGASELK